MTFDADTFMGNLHAAYADAEYVANQITVHKTGHDTFRDHNSFMFTAIETELKARGSDGLQQLKDVTDKAISDAYEDANSFLESVVGQGHPDYDMLVNFQGCCINYKHLVDELRAAGIKQA